MNALLLTVLATLGGTNGDAYQYAAAGHGGHAGPAYAAPVDGGCDACQAGGHGGHGHWLGAKPPRGGWLGMMPQTCYNPRFGCYDGDRFNHRYPAFHGTYYRRPYNYRNVFDYPWHADLHEPTSMFSYNVEEAVVPAAVSNPPVPVPAETTDVRFGDPSLPAPQASPVQHLEDKPATRSVLRRASFNRQR